MRLSGQNVPAQFTQAVSLPRADGSEWSFTMQPLPLGFHRRLREQGILPPVAPTRVSRDSQGRPQRDEAGLAVVISDTADREYLAASELYHQRVAVLAVVESLRADPRVQFESPCPDQTAERGVWERYADALYAELEQTGFSAGDLILLCTHVSRLSNLIGDHLQQARTNFSSPQIAASP